MKFFVDTAEIKAIKELYATGLFDGVTTNPSLIAKSGRDFKEIIDEICALVPGPVLAEVASLEFEGMVAEGEHLAKIADNVVIKLPPTLNGLKATKHFFDKGIKTNVTLCFSPKQGLLAAKVGTTYISPFLGSFDDINLNGVEMIKNIRQIYYNYNFETQILAASIRSPNPASQVAMAGSDVATIPPDVIHKLANHPLTNTGIEGFLKDWRASGQSIL